MNNYCDIFDHQNQNINGQHLTSLE